MKKKLIMLGIMMVIGSGFNAHANSAEFTETYPSGSSSNMTASGTGLRLTYTESGKGFAATDSIVSSSLIQILEGKEAVWSI